jgi:hypothetical protein
MRAVRRFVMSLASIAVLASTACPTSLSAAGHTTVQQKNLANFDDLDFRVYSGQKWDELKLSHAPDILVHYPDGTTSRGIPDHVAKLKPQFAFAPDTAIKEHPIKLADASYTAVEGVMTGTFSKPLDMGNGKAIQPTGKTFTLPMMTVGRWENGLMKEEWLFWDNASFMQQIGVGQ